MKNRDAWQHRQGVSKSQIFGKGRWQWRDSGETVKVEKVMLLNWKAGDMQERLANGSSPPGAKGTGKFLRPLTLSVWGRLLGSAREEPQNRSRSTAIERSQTSFRP
jgi:hypothetical protein